MRSAVLQLSSVHPLLLGVCKRNVAFLSFPFIGRAHSGALRGESPPGTPQTASILHSLRFSPAASPLGTIAADVGPVSSPCKLSRDLFE